MKDGFAFDVWARDGDARAGRFTTPHGVVATPAFLAVATYGSVRGVAPDELRALGAQMLLANTFHLHERPGEAAIAAAGGLHGFTGWRGPWLTDSGGYQVLSLASHVEVDDSGARFASPLTGERRTLTPESAVAIQEALGADVAVALDQCVAIGARRGAGAGKSAASDAGEEASAARGGTRATGRPAVEPDPSGWRDAMERSLRWGERCRKAHRRADQALFGIVQGGADAALRRASARATAAQGFDGYAHGGLGLGEEAALREALLAEAHAELPPGAPRYLMGLGRPDDVLRAIERGIDLFDCVLPTRHGRHALVFTRAGPLALRNARFRDDHAPIEAGCDCPACRHHGRGFLRHLFQSRDMLGPRLATLHNLRFYYRLFEDARRAVAASRLRELREQISEAAADP